MPAPTLPQNLTPEDYEAIEGAVMETVRGRWFLMEFARRSRAVELAQIRDAVARLERALTIPLAPAVSVLHNSSPAEGAAPMPDHLTAAEPAAAPSVLHQALEALSRFDRLPVVEKIALFA